MTKAMRWGVTALMIVGGVGLGTVAGCSDDEDTPPTTDTGTVDTGVPADTTPADTGMPDPDTGTPPTDGGGDADAAPPFVPDRAITVSFASPDLGGKFICVGGFAGPDPTTSAEPVQALGPPAGIPDATAPTDPTKFKAFPYGAVVPFPLTKLAQDFLDTPLTAALYLVPDTSKDCKKAWADVKADKTLWVAVPGKTIAKGDHALIRIHGCKTPATGTTGECGAATGLKPLTVDFKKLDTKTPATFGGGTTGPKVGIQFVHMSPFPGNAVPPVPSFQNIDVYIQPMAAAAAGDAGTDGGDAAATPTPAGTPVKIASGVSYGDVAAASVGIQLAGDPSEAILLITAKDVAPCTPGSAGCATVALPVKAALAAFKGTGGGFNDGQNQFIGLAGSPVPKDLTMPATTRTIVVQFGKVSPIP